MIVWDVCLNDDFIIESVSKLEMVKRPTIYYDIPTHAGSPSNGKFNYVVTVEASDVNTAIVKTEEYINNNLLREYHD